jgi:hypothetical protein
MQLNSIDNIIENEDGTYKISILDIENKEIIIV